MSTREDREWDERQEYGYGNPLDGGFSRMSAIIADRFGPIENEDEEEMTGQTVWLSAQRITVDGTAYPGRIYDGEESNAVAVVRIQQDQGHHIMIEGRPEQLLDIARQIIGVAEVINTTTMLDNDLRSLYGITEPTPPQHVSPPPPAPPLGQSEHDHNL